MISVPNSLITTLIRVLPVVLANTDTRDKSTRVQNAVRQTKIVLNKLLIINQKSTKQ